MITGYSAQGSHSADKVPDSTRQSPSLVILAIWEGTQKSFASVKLDTKMDTISPKTWTQLVQE